MSVEGSGGVHSVQGLTAACMSVGRVRVPRAKDKWSRSSSQACALPGALGRPSPPLAQSRAAREEKMRKRMFCGRL